MITYNQSTPCAWQYVSEQHRWTTSCGTFFLGILEDAMIFCPYCGKKISKTK